MCFDTMETSWNLFLSQQMNWIQAWQTGNWSTDDLLQVCESIIYLPLESFKDPLTIRLLITFQIITMCLWYSWQLLFPPIHTHVGVGIWQVCPFHLVYVLKPSVSYKTMKQERTCLIKILLLEMYAKWRASNRSSNRRFHPLPWECKGWQRDLHRTQNERNNKWWCASFLLSWKRGNIWIINMKQSIREGNCLYSPLGRFLTVNYAVTEWMHFLSDYWESWSCLNEPIRNKITTDDRVWARGTGCSLLSC